MLSNFPKNFPQDLEPYFSRYFEDLNIITDNNKEIGGFKEDIEFHDFNLEFFSNFDLKHGDFFMINDEGDGAYVFVIEGKNNMYLCLFYMYNPNFFNVLLPAFNCFNPKYISTWDRDSLFYEGSKSYLLSDFLDKIEDIYEECKNKTIPDSNFKVGEIVKLKEDNGHSIWVITDYMIHEKLPYIFINLRSLNNPDAGYSVKGTNKLKKIRKEIMPWNAVYLKLNGLTNNLRISCSFYGLDFPSFKSKKTIEQILQKLRRPEFYYNNFYIYISGDETILHFKNIYNLFEENNKLYTRTYDIWSDTEKIEIVDDCLVLRK